jgi:hypothetical protein
MAAIRTKPITVKMGAMSDFFIPTVLMGVEAPVSKIKYLIKLSYIIAILE